MPNPFHEVALPELPPLVLDVASLAGPIPPALHVLCALALPALFVGVLPRQQLPSFAPPLLLALTVALLAHVVVPHLPVVVSQLLQAGLFPLFALQLQLPVRTYLLGVVNLLV